LVKLISQLELCQKAEITQTFLSLLEHGRRNPSREVLKKIADVLHEDAAMLEKEASSPEYDLEAHLDRLVKQVVVGRNRKKLGKLIEFIENL